MGFLYFAGVILLGSGPVSVVFLKGVSPCPLYVLVCLSSATAWLLSTTASSLVLRPLTPLHTESSFLNAATQLLISSIGIEATRYALFVVLMRGVSRLRCIAQNAGLKPPTSLDIAGASLAVGTGMGIGHCVFFQWTTVFSALDPATLTAPTCRGLPYLTATAVLTLAFSLLHVCGTVVIFESLQTRAHARAYFVSAINICAAFLTVFNRNDNGCFFTLPLILVSALVVFALGLITTTKICRTAIARSPSALAQKEVAQNKAAATVQQRLHP